MGFVSRRALGMETSSRDTDWNDSEFVNDAPPMDNGGDAYLPLDQGQQLINDAPPLDGPGDAPYLPDQQPFTLIDQPLLDGPGHSPYVPDQQPITLTGSGLTNDGQPVNDPIELLAEPVRSETPHVDVLLPPASNGAPLSPSAPAASGYPRAYVASEWPRTIITDQSGRPVNPDDLMVVVDQMGIERIVPKYTATAPAVITAYTPDLVDWRPEPGTGTPPLVLRKFVNGQSTQEVAASSPTFDADHPERAFDSMTEAQKLAFWTAVDPDAAIGFADFASRDGSPHLTTTGQDALAILNAVGASAAVDSAARVTQTSVSAATARTDAKPAVPAVLGPPTTRAVPKYTATSRASTDPILKIAAIPIVSVTDQANAPTAGGWKWGVAIAAGIALAASLSRS